MAIRWILAWIAWIAFLTAAHAAELAEYGLVSGSFPSFSSQTTSADISPGLSTGFGISLTYDFHAPFALEAGLLYFTRSYSQTLPDSPTYKYELKSYQIPIILRYRLNEHLAVGGGIYRGQASGSVVRNDGSTQSSADYNDSGLGITDFGFLVSARYRQRVFEVIHFIADGRALLGTTNRSNSSDTSLVFNDLQLLLGIAFVL